MEQKQVAAEKQVLSKLQKMQLDQDQRAAALAKEAQAEELQVRIVRVRVGVRFVGLGFKLGFRSGLAPARTPFKTAGSWSECSC